MFVDHHGWVEGPDGSSGPSPFVGAVNSDQARIIERIDAQKRRSISRATPRTTDASVNPRKNIQMSSDFFMLWVFGCIFESLFMLSLPWVEESAWGSLTNVGDGFIPAVFCAIFFDFFLLASVKNRPEDPFPWPGNNNKVSQCFSMVPGSL